MINRYCYLTLLMIACIFPIQRCFAQKYYVEKYNNENIIIGGEKVDFMFKNKIAFTDNSEIKISHHKENVEDSLKIKGLDWLCFESVKILKRNNGSISNGESVISFSIKDYYNWYKDYKQSSPGNRSAGGRFKLGSVTTNENECWTTVFDNEVNGNYKENRLALVVGNSYYDFCDSLDDVPACVKSANVVARKLRKIGFHTIVLYNAEKESIESALDYFFKEDYGGGRKMVKLFYYVGHGMRNRNDFIIPVDVTDKNDTTQCVNISKIAYSLDSKEQNGNYNILFVDACRNGDNIYVDNNREEEYKLNNTRVVFATSMGETASTDSNLTVFTRPFLKYIKCKNKKIGWVYDMINEGVIGSNRNQKTTSYPNSEFYVRNQILNKEKFLWFAGVGVNGQILFSSGKSTALSPNITVSGTNIYIWRQKTQFEIEFGWNVLDKKTSPVYLYDKYNNLNSVSAFRNTWNVSCRYGPSFDFCRKWRFSPMVGISYHYLCGSNVDEMTIGAVSSYCCNMTFDCELSYIFYKKYKLNIILGTSLYRFYNVNYDRFKDIAFLNDWYVFFKNVNAGVGLSMRLGK